jgi:kinesin family protein 11
VLAVKKNPLSMSVSAAPTDEKKPAKRATRLTVAGLAAACVAAETMGREKENVVNLSASVGPGIGRRLRSRGSD